MVGVGAWVWADAGINVGVQLGDVGVRFIFTIQIPGHILGHFLQLIFIKNLMFIQIHSLNFFKYFFTYYVLSSYGFNSLNFFLFNFFIFIFFL